jgi:cytochrome c oxidase subunit 4
LDLSLSSTVLDWGALLKVKQQGWFANRPYTLYLIRGILMAGHVVPKKLYILVFAALILFTGLTTGVAFVNLGKWNTVVALAIAVCKASLVVLFFMHLRWSTGLMRMVLLSAFMWFAILVALTLSDEFTRQWTPVPSSWEAQIQQGVR